MPKVWQHAKNRKVREIYLQTNMDSQIVADFKTQTKEGPYYICVVCNRCLYRKSVISFKIENYGDVKAVPFSYLMMGIHISVEHETKQ